MFDFIIYFFVFIFGLIIGSFLNCVIYRLEKEESFLFGRSYCPHCKKTLKAMDLIPILSFMALRGKCRYCKKKISWQYPLVELGTAFLFILLFQHFGLGSNFLGFVFYSAIFCFLIVVFVYDLKHFLIPDKIIYPAIALALIYNFFNLNNLLFNFLPSALGGFVFFLIIFLISQGKWLGFGDVKLVFLLGLFLGFPNILLALFLSFTIGAIIGIGLIVLKRKNLKSEVPFAPFLVLGSLIAFFWGEKILNWYLSLIVY
ncbi:MAG: prepilin peptidase [Candidatus Nealsonbacteria bacterium]|nr:prepilin peptidase [Candidatus Nealsonbacteria bacterium]